MRSDRIVQEDARRRQLRGLLHGEEYEFASAIRRAEEVTVNTPIATESYKKITGYFMDAGLLGRKLKHAGRDEPDWLF